MHTPESLVSTPQLWLQHDPLAAPFSQSLDETRIDGVIAPGYEDVAATFLNNFRRGEIGASFALAKGGRLVVDLWGGFARPESGAPWQDDTIAVMYSCSKIPTALALHWLLEQERCELDAPLTAYWPELRAGQLGGTLRMLLGHTIGLPALSRKLPRGAYNDHGLMARRLEQQEPFWPPGSRVGYHPITFGFLIGELVRRLDGRSLGQLVWEQFAQPLGLDLHIGLDSSAFARTATIFDHMPEPDETPRQVARQAAEIGSIQNLWLFNSGDWRTAELNTPEGLAAEVPAASGVSNARSMAALMALFNDRERMKSLGFSSKTLDRLREVSAASHIDATLLCRSRFALGLMKSMDNRSNPGADNFIIGEAAFGHVGHGGSFAFCDPELDVAASYVMNAKGPGILLNDRGQSLIDAVYACAAG